MILPNRHERNCKIGARLSHLRLSQSEDTYFALKRRCGGVVELALFDICVTAVSIPFGATILLLAWAADEAFSTAHGTSGTRYLFSS